MAKSIIALLLFGLISSKAASQSFLMHRELPKGVKILLNADKNSKVIYKGKDIAIVKSKAGFLVTANEPAVIGSIDTVIFINKRKKDTILNVLKICNPQFEMSFDRFDQHPTNSHVFVSLNPPQEIMISIKGLNKVEESLNKIKLKEAEFTFYMSDSTEKRYVVNNENLNLMFADLRGKWRAYDVLAAYRLKVTINKQEYEASDVTSPKNRTV